MWFLILKTIEFKTHSSHMRASKIYVCLKHSVAYDRRATIS